MLDTNFMRLTVAATTDTRREVAQELAALRARLRKCVRLCITIQKRQTINGNVKCHSACGHGPSCTSVGWAAHQPLSCLHPLMMLAGLIASVRQQTAASGSTTSFSPFGFTCPAVRSGSGRRSSSAPGRPRLRRLPPPRLPAWSPPPPRTPRRRAARRQRRRPAAQQTKVGLAAACSSACHVWTRLTDSCLPAARCKQAAVSFPRSVTFHVTKVWARSA